MIQQILAYGLIGAGALGLAVLGVMYLRKRFAGSFTMPAIGGGKPAAPAALDDDTLDFQSHGRLQRRFTQRGCKEGLDACVVQLQHFYHGEGEHK